MSSRAHPSSTTPACFSRSSPCSWRYWPSVSSQRRPERRWRAFQFLIILPSGALPLVTGGDDLPVLALMLLALVLAQRRQPVWSGVVMGVAGTLKFTAWGLLLLLALAEFDRYGRRAVGRYLLAAAVVVVPVIAFGIAIGPHSFVLNASTSRSGSRRCTLLRPARCRARSSSFSCHI